MFRACMGESKSVSSFESQSAEEGFVPIEPVVHTIPVLVEVVGATNLLGVAKPISDSQRQNRRKSFVPPERSPPDPYCVISIQNVEVHKTQTIFRDENPIWTVKTNSLCIIHVPGHHDDGGDGDGEKHQTSKTTTKTTKTSEEEIKTFNSSFSTEKTLPRISASSSSSSSKDCFTAEVFSGKRSLGEVKLEFANILQCKGERLEFPISEDWQSCRSYYEDYNGNGVDIELPQSMLALRFRRATSDDIAFVQNLLDQQRGENLLSTAVGTAVGIGMASAKHLHRSLSMMESPTHDEEAMDVDFRRVITKGLFGTHRRHDDKTGDTLIRLQPPLRDPGEEEGEEPVEWMTKERIQETALQPSTKWVETGNGKAGTLYLEIIGCDDLPSMDMDGFTDPFVSVVFENTMVRTKVIFDTLCPRWLPWSTRAFAINITHPGSMIFLGVFDYDEDLAITDYCDPIGRVVINTINFESSVTYMLHYDLIDSSQLDTPRGTITVRLRMEWENENEAAKLALRPPPRFIINVETEKSWHVLHYCTYGAINMDKASMASVKLYWSEVYELWRNYCYFLDVMVGILLWRGRTNVSFLGYTLNIWFPIQSVWLFTSVAIAYEKPAFAPAIFFYGLAWIMISLNFYNSRHPYHWHRVKKFETLVMGILTGSTVSCTKTVEANQYFEEFFHYQELDTLKADRMMALLYAFMTTGLKAYRIYSGTYITNVVDTTQDTSWYFMSDKLYYPHMLLKYICKYGRSYRNFLNWKSYASLPKTLNFLFLGSVCMITPLHGVASVVGRILIWTFLGPLMKVLDIAVIRKYYKTNEQLLDDIVKGRQDRDYWFLPFFDSIIEHDVFRSMRRSGRIVAERAAKLKDMRESLHGEWSERVPWIDNSRRPSIPLPKSSARPWREEDELEQSQRADWKFLPGKKLVGDMIPRSLGRKDSKRCIGASERVKKEQ